MRRAEIGALALRAFGYGWKYREAPFGEAAYVDQAGQSVRLAGDWIVPIKPALSPLARHGPAARVNGHPGAYSLAIYRGDSYTWTFRVWERRGAHRAR